MKKQSRQLLSSLLGIAFMLAMWLALYLVVANEYLMPPPSEVARDFVKLLTEGYFYSALGITLLRVLVSFAISFALSMAFATLSYYYQRLEGALEVVVSVLRSLPTLAILLLLLVWDRTIAPIVVCILALFPMTYPNILNSLKAVGSDLVEMCRIYRVPVSKQIKEMYVPYVLPNIVTSISSGISFSLKLIVSAEILSSLYASMGGLMNEASMYGDTTMLLALTLTVCLIGIAVDVLGSVISSKVRVIE